VVQLLRQAKAERVYGCDRGQDSLASTSQTARPRREVSNMGIEWFRDLSIAILGFMTTAVLIFTAILVYRLYRMMKSTLLLVKEASKIAYDTVSQVQEGIKPVLSILSVIQGILGGFDSISKLFKKRK
jgi:hypothetical protein